MPWTTIEFGEAQIEPGKPAVALERCGRALGGDEALGGEVEVGGGDARAALRASIFRQRAWIAPAAAICSICSGVLRMIPLRYIVLTRVAPGEASSSSSMRNVARSARIWSDTSSGGRSPSTRLRMPAVLVVGRPAGLGLGVVLVEAMADDLGLVVVADLELAPQTSQTPSFLGGSNSTWKMWPLAQVRRPPSRRTTSSSETSIRIATDSSRPSSPSLASSASAWRRVRGKPSRMKPFGLLGVEALADHVDHQLVRREVAAVHVLLDLLAQLASFADGGPQDVARGRVGQVEVLLEAFALGALAGAGRAEQHEVQLGHEAGSDARLRRGCPG